MTGLTSEPQKVVIIGQGYVGLPLAMRAVEVGHQVVGYDVDKTKISTLASGRSYIDDVTDDDIDAALQTGRFRPSEAAGDLAGFDVAVITVPTPLTDGAPNTSFIEAAATLVSKYVEKDSTVILESTTYPGTTRDLVQPLLEDGSGLSVSREFHLGYSPERIDPGNEVWNFQRTPKVVSGVNPASLERVVAFYDDLVDQTVPVASAEEAELAKLLENTFRHVNIALVNELAIHARSMGIDFWNVVEAARTKPFGFMAFLPGPGVGGHCLPVDPSYLSWQFERQLGAPSRFVEIANDINNGMPAYVAGRVQAGLNHRRKAVNGSTILILGLAYKKNSNDARETPATALILKLRSLGADVRAHDPFVGEYELDDLVTRVDVLTDDELTAADAVVLITDHDVTDYQRVVELADYVFDARHTLPSGGPVEHL